LKIKDTEVFMNEGASREAANTDGEGVFMESEARKPVFGLISKVADAVKPLGVEIFGFEQIPNGNITITIMPPSETSKISWVRLGEPENHEKAR
jgi:hypothetical protein